MENEIKRGRKKKEIDGNFAKLLSELLQKVKAENGIIQDDVAKAIGVSRQALGKWANGETVPDIIDLKKLAEYFKVSADYLLGLTDNPTTDTNLKAVCEFTGLNEEAVEFFRDHLTDASIEYEKEDFNSIEEYNEYVKDILQIKYKLTKITNNFITMDYFGYFLCSVSNIEESSAKWVEICKANIKQNGQEFYGNDETEKLEYECDIATLECNRWIDAFIQRHDHRYKKQEIAVFRNYLAFKNINEQVLAEIEEENNGEHNPRKNKDGVITSYTIRVYHGYDKTGKRLKPYTMSYKPAPNMTARQIEKELNRQAVQFEEQCKLGYSLDNRQTFAEYAAYVVSLKERAGVKHSVICWYKAQLERINAGIGHLKLCEIRPQHLNALYEQLSAQGLRENGKKAVCKIDLSTVLKASGRTKVDFAKAAGVSVRTLASCCEGNSVSYSTAEKIAKELNSKVTAIFDISEDNTALSQSTISGYHRCISAILAQAEKEMLIPFNPAAKATPPKKKKPQPNYFQPADIDNIREALEKEPIKWKTLAHLLLITGARRGEIAGLKWSAVDWNNSRIHINVTLLNRTDIGIYEDTPKTEQSDRYITLPAETMNLLREYRAYWVNYHLTCGTAWNNFVTISDKNGNAKNERADYLFFQEQGNKIGYPMRPDSITKWCADFSKRNGLPHINPHAFRHTMASILYFNGVDGISISSRLGHSKASTTSDIYSHIIKEADKQSAECIADVILRKKQG